MLSVSLSGDLNCISGATAKHGVFIWDIGKSKIIKKFTEVHEFFLVSNESQGSDLYPV